MPRFASFCTTLLFCALTVWAQNSSRLHQLETAIDQQPDSPLLAKAAASLSPPGDFKAIIAAWQRQVTKHPDDARVLANAVNGLYQVNYSLTVECLKRLRRIEPTNPKWPVLLASLYAGAVANADLAPKAQADLAASTDLPVVGLVGQGLHSLAIKAKAQPLSDYADSLLKQAQALDPMNPRWTPGAADNPALVTERDMWPFGAIAAMPVPGGAVRVAAEAQAAKAIRHEAPECTPDVLPCPKMKSTVKLGVVVGKDGRVKTMHAASGDMSTIPAAMDAIRQWTYQPTLVAGKPVEVATEVEAVLMPPGAAPHVSSNFTPPVALTQPEPEYTPQAHAAKFEGSVQLSLMVDERGRPRDIKVIHSAGLGLDDKAIEAVKKWTFRPGMRDGKPVAVRANVEVRFRAH